MAKIFLRRVSRRANALAHSAMTGKMRRKGDLPTRDCTVCGRPFAWRRKWRAVWDEVRHCSDACRRGARTQRRRGAV